MAFSKSKLLLTADREAQLTAALANATVTDPLTTICAEQEARITLALGEYTVATALQESIIRAFALHHAYSLAEGSIPADIAALYEDAQKQLAAIQAASDPTSTTSNLAGASGSRTAFAMRTDA